MTCSRCRAAPAARGLDVEGLGIVYLEASAVGLPVVAGDSGGAPDAVRDGETGFVVDGRDAARGRRAGWSSCCTTRTARARWAPPAARGSQQRVARGTSWPPGSPRCCDR